MSRRLEYCFDVRIAEQLKTHAMMSRRLDNSLEVFTAEHLT